MAKDALGHDISETIWSYDNVGNKLYGTPNFNNPTVRARFQPGHPDYEADWQEHVKAATR